MPSGRTHDIITLTIAPATFALAQVYWRSIPIALVSTLSMIFAGFMFGPDLDLASKQYRRWGPLRPIWLPYVVIFKHRSHLSHGLLLGTLVRIIYFLAMIVAVTTVALYVRQVWWLGQPASLRDQFAIVWTWCSEAWQRTDRNYSKAAFVGLWLGAAAHTVSDVVWSITRKLAQLV